MKITVSQSLRDANYNFRKWKVILTHHTSFSFNFNLSSKFAHTSPITRGFSLKTTLLNSVLDFCCTCIWETWLTAPTFSFWTKMNPFGLDFSKAMYEAMGFWLAYTNGINRRQEGVMLCREMLTLVAPTNANRHLNTRGNIDQTYRALKHYNRKLMYLSTSSSVLCPQKMHD